MKLQTILFIFLAFGLGVFNVQAESIVREFPANSGQKLDLDLSVGADIQIEGWNEERIQVKIISDNADDYDIRFIRNSWGLKIEAEYTKKFSKHHGDIELEIRVPRKFDLALHTLGGDIDLEDIEGTFKGKTLGGDIEISGLKGYAELSTLGGDVEVSDSELDGHVKTMGGDVSFEDVVGSIRGKTLGGEVSYDNYRPRDSHRPRDYEELDRTERELTAEQEAYLKEREAYDRERKENYRRDRDEFADEREEYARKREEYRREREEHAREREEHARERAEHARERAEKAGERAEVERRESEVARWDRDYKDRDDDRNSRVININKMGGDIRLESARSGAKVKTMGGDIEIRDAEEFVVATTFGGDIKLDDVNGWVTAKTYGGDIEVNLVGNERYGKRDVELVSFSGDVELTVPRGMDMNIDIELAYTKNYNEEPKIVSDFELDIEETKEWDRSKGQAKRYLYGKGETGSARHTIRIQTINGSVYLREK